MRRAWTPLIGPQVAIANWAKFYAHAKADRNGRNDDISAERLRDIVEEAGWIASVKALAQIRVKRLQPPVGHDTCYGALIKLPGKIGDECRYFGQAPQCNK